jgi:DNA repair protein RadC
MPCYTPVYRCALVREGSVATQPQLTSTVKARAVCNEFLADSPCEQFVAVLLDTKHRVIGLCPITVGVLDASLVHPREVFRPAIVHNASAVILAHNHPSGDLTPSREDCAVMEQLDKVADIVGIKVLDFIIVDGQGNAASMREEGGAS